MPDNHNTGLSPRKCRRLNMSCDSEKMQVKLDKLKFDNVHKYKYQKYSNINNNKYEKSM